MVEALSKRDGMGCDGRSMLPAVQVYVEVAARRWPISAASFASPSTPDVSAAAALAQHLATTAAAAAAAAANTNTTAAWCARGVALCLARLHRTARRLARGVRKGHGAR